jgi:hypothetical protein
VRDRQGGGSASPGLAAITGGGIPDVLPNTPSLRADRAGLRSQRGFSGCGTGIRVDAVDDHVHDYE